MFISNIISDNVYRKKESHIHFHYLSELSLKAATIKHIILLYAGCCQGIKLSQLHEELSPLYFDLWILIFIFTIW